MNSPPDLIVDLIGLGGAGLRLIDLDGPEPEDAIRQPGIVRLGVTGGRALGWIDPEGFDILLCDEPLPPAPWVGATSGALPAVIDGLKAAVARQPVAASVAAQVLRMSLNLKFDDALALESLAYSMLLASRDFKRWREQNPPRDPSAPKAQRVTLDVAEDAITITLNRPEARNAVDAEMRDALVEALAFAQVHPDQPPVCLRGKGPAFCAGGDLAEFGRAGDPGLAHMIRTLRAPARLARQLSERLTVRAHGACIGAGVEVAAAAARVIARPGAVFRLPEVSMGLIPGAGGTATISRRTGRHRACYMALSGAEIDLDTALHWRLVDGVEPAP